MLWNLFSSSATSLPDGEGLVDDAEGVKDDEDDAVEEEEDSTAEVVSKELLEKGRIIYRSRIENIKNKSNKVY